MAFKIPRFNRAARVSELMDKKLVDRHLERDGRARHIAA